MGTHNTLGILCSLSVTSDLDAMEVYKKDTGIGFWVRGLL